jgi:general secretion pathway protein A
MYTKYYGFSHKPFELTPDPDVIFLSETHQEAISVLHYGIINHKGFLQLTGNVGIGKSTLLQSLIKSLENNVHLCYIPNPNFTVQEFYYYIGAKFGLEEFDGNKAKFIISLGRFLQKCREKNEHVLLIIDEAQVLALEVLEEIRLISNQEFHDDFGVLSIFLVGQPELNTLLDHKKLLPLRNRIAISFHIDSLTLAETTAYIGFRLRKAGSKAALFSSDACREIHRTTAGIPRTINILCDNSLLAGFAAQRGIIDDKTIKDCARELMQIENNMPLSEATPEETEVDKNVLSTKPLSDESKKRTAFLLPRRVALAIVALCVFFIAITATTEYWGRIPGITPVKVWFEKVNVHFESNILPPLKKIFIKEKYKTESSTTDIHPFYENIIEPPGISDKKNIKAEFGTDKKKTYLKRLKQAVLTRL